MKFTGRIQLQGESSLYETGSDLVSSWEPEGRLENAFARSLQQLTEFQAQIDELCDQLVESQAQLESLQSQVLEREERLGLWQSETASQAIELAEQRAIALVLERKLFDSQGLSSRLLHQLALLRPEPVEHLLAARQDAYQALRAAHTVKLQRKLRKQRAELSSYRAELKLRQSLLSEARTELERARQEREELVGKLAEEREKRSEVSLTAESELAGLRKRVTELGESVTRRRQAMAAARRHLAQEQDRLAQARRESQRQDEVLAERERELQTLHESLELSERQREGLEQERHELLRALKQVECRQSELEAEREQLLADLNRAQSQQGELEDERERLLSDLQAAERKHGELLSKLAESEHQRHEVQAERDRLLQNLEAAERHQGELEDERGELLSALGEAEAQWQNTQHELARAEQRAETVQGQLADLLERQRLASETQPGAALESELARTLEEERRRQSLELESERSRLNRELQALDDMRGSLERERQALEAGQTLDLSVLAGERAALEKERERLEADLESLAGRQEQVEGELERQRTELALEGEALDSQRARFAGERIELDRERSRLEHELEVLESERARLASERSQLERERVALKSQARSMDEEDLEQERARLRQDLAESSAGAQERERLKHELERLQQEHKALQHELQSARASVSEPDFEAPRAAPMTRLQASWDGQFLLAQQGQDGWLEHQGRPVWKRSIPPDHRLLWVGNNGEAIFARELGGVVRILPQPEQAPREVEYLRTGQDQSHLGKLRVNVDGRTICWERIVPEERLSDRIFRLLGKKSVAHGSLSHSIGLLDLHTGASQSYVSAVLPRVREERFWWEISPHFLHLVVGLTEQTGFLFRVINITGRALAGEFRVPVQDLAQLWINDEGTVMVDIQGDGSALDLYRLDRKLQITAPPRSTVLRLGPHWVAFQTDQTELVVKSFLNEECLRKDLSQLSRPGVQHRLRVTEKAQLDLMTLENENLAFERHQLELPSE